jgi:transcription antitermination factor NusG
VSSCQLILEPAQVLPVEDTRWFAIQTVARHEKRVAGHFREQQIPTFLPLLKQLHQWSDRRMQIQVPLFSCYVFVRLSQQRQIRDRILRTPGVLGFVGGRGQGTSIPNDQVESIRRILEEDVPFGFHPFLEAGNRVRIRGGSLDGVEGILVEKNRDQSVVVSVELLRRSLSVRIEGYALEPA